MRDPGVIYISSGVLKEPFDIILRYCLCIGVSFHRPLLCPGLELASECTPDRIRMCRVDNVWLRDLNLSTSEMNNERNLGLISMLQCMSSLANLFSTLALLHYAVGLLLFNLTPDFYFKNFQLPSFSLSDRLTFTHLQGVSTHPLIGVLTFWAALCRDRPPFPILEFVLRFIWTFY